MANIENKRGRNSRRPMGSGLAAVRPESMNLGPGEHTKVPGPYTVIEQLGGQNRMVITERNIPSVNKAKNNWTGTKS